MPLNITFTVDVPADLNLTNLIYTTYSQDPWPQQWSKITVPMHLTIENVTDILGDLQHLLNGLLGAHLTVVGQPRLGLAVTVEKAGTGGGDSGGLEFMYDHPTFDSRLEVDTSRVPASCPSGVRKPAARSSCGSLLS